MSANSVQESLAQLKLDQAELERFIESTDRPKVKEFLTKDLCVLRNEMRKLDELLKGSESNVSPGPEAPVQKRNIEVKLNDYAWGQSKSNVTFYVNLPKVHAIPRENVACDFKPQSFELKVRDLDGKDYHFSINKLLHAIVPEKSSTVVKTDSVRVVAAKADTNETWSHVTLIEKRASEAKKLKTPDVDSAADPSQGLMSIMKEMYNQGDDEMKRTIAKAWTESQSKGPAF